jgi:hypothetical protein
MTPFASSARKLFPRASNNHLARSPPSRDVARHEPIWTLTDRARKQSFKTRRSFDVISINLTVHLVADRREGQSPAQDPPQHYPALRRRCTQRSPPFRQSVVDDRWRQPWDWVQPHHLARNGNLPRFQFAQFGDQRDRIATCLAGRDQQADPLSMSTSSRVERDLLIAQISLSWFMPRKALVPDYLRANIGKVVVPVGKVVVHNHIAPARRLGTGGLAAMTVPSTASPEIQKLHGEAAVAA